MWYKIVKQKNQHLRKKEKKVRLLTSSPQHHSMNKIEDYDLKAVMLAEKGSLYLQLMRIVRVSSNNRHVK